VRQVANHTGHRQRHGGIPAGRIGLSAFSLAIGDGLADGIGIAEELACRRFGQHHRFGLLEYLSGVADDHRQLYDLEEIRVDHIDTFWKLPVAGGQCHGFGR
jgi:hypothetical protein